jgi:ATP-dependent Zn protease
MKHYYFLPEWSNLKYIIVLIVTIICLANASATTIDIVYVNANTTAQMYFNNGSTQYQYNETNTLTDSLNTLMITGTVDNSKDLIDDPSVVYEKVIYILAVIFFAFMFILVVWIIKKVIG